MGTMSSSPSCPWYGCHRKRSIRHYLELIGILEKRREGAGSDGGSKVSAGLSGTSGFGSSPESGSSHPSAAKSDLSIKGSSPSKSDKPVGAPKKPTLPKLPKPKSGWKPPKGKLPGRKPDHPPDHSSGGNRPITFGGQTHDNGHASLDRSCINPKGFERLRCEKADAVIVFLLAIMALLLGPFLVRSVKRRMNKRRSRDEEDGTELRGRMRNRDPLPEPEGVSDSASNIGLAISTSEEAATLAKEEEQNQNRSSGSGLVQTPSRVYQPGAAGPSRRSRSHGSSPPRGRKRSRDEVSLTSLTRSLSSGMIRTAKFGQRLQDATIIDMPPSRASSRESSGLASSCRGNDGSYDSDSHDDGRRDAAEFKWCDCMEINEVDGKEAESLRVFRPWMKSARSL